MKKKKDKQFNKCFALFKMHIQFPSEFVLRFYGLKKYKQCLFFLNKQITQSTDDYNNYVLPRLHNFFLI